MQYKLRCVDQYNDVNVAGVAGFEVKRDGLLLLNLHGHHPTPTTPRPR